MPLELPAYRGRFLVGPNVTNLDKAHSSPGEAPTWSSIVPSPTSPAVEVTPVVLGHLSTVIESAVLEATPSEKQVRKRNLRPAVHRPQLTRRQENKKMYVLTQNLYKKNRGRYYNSIVNRSLGSEFKVTRAFVEGFWVKIMTPSNKNSAGPSREATISLPTRQSSRVARADSL
ncbi:hypothetical protein AVEN_106358-1 [Araneus ventricosus]|uniref:Uncharacterized protein n=1 Tax=Araneus ventricosus TaxID=182803 RepID=A0A4Y2AS78_ARAVE|nr:hypothetical protein AVEN_106358-1 [Araneus ventricosus]